MFFLKNTSDEFNKSRSKYLGVSGIICGILFCIESIRRYFSGTDIFGTPTYQSDIGSLIFLFSVGFITFCIGLRFYKKSTNNIK